jgi:hypothetical protein
MAGADPRKAGREARIRRLSGRPLGVPPLRHHTGNIRWLGPKVRSGGCRRGCGAAGRRQAAGGAEIGGQFSQEETAPLIDGASEGAAGGYAPPPAPLKPDDPATMTSRFEPSDTAGAFAALDRLAKTPDVRVLGGSIEVNGTRSEHDFMTLRIGGDVPVTALDLDGLVKSLVAQLNAQSPTVKLRLDRIDFPSGRELMAFCDATGQDFDRVNWTQD